MREKIAPLSEWRKSLEKTPSQMARFLEVPHTTYIRWESGVTPTFPMAIRVGEKLGINSLRALKGLFVPSNVQRRTNEEAKR